MLEQRCNHWKQCRNNVATLRCAKTVVVNCPVEHHLYGGHEQETTNSRRVRLHLTKLR